MRKVTKATVVTVKTKVKGQNSQNSVKVQGIQKGTLDKKRPSTDLVYFKKVKRRQIQNLFTSAEISGDVIRRGRIFAKLRT